MFGFEGAVAIKKAGDKEQQALYNNKIILDSSMVEHSAVNRVVVGSSPTRGAKKSTDKIKLSVDFLYSFLIIHWEDSNDSDLPECGSL